MDDNMSVAISNTGVITGTISAVNTNLTATTVSTNSAQSRTKAEDILDRYALNEFIVEHRVQEQELLKLKEQNVDYADVIKENMAKSLSRDVIKKVTFTKKLEPDTFVHSFRGRCWVFTKEELTKMIEDIRNGV